MALLRRIIFIMLCALFFSGAAEVFGSTIVLLGSSSAGKSTLAKVLQELLGRDAIIEHYDTFRREFLIHEGKKLGLLEESYDTATGMQVLKDLEQAASCATFSVDERMAKQAFLARCRQDLEEAFYQRIAAIPKEQNVIVDAFVINNRQLTTLQKYLGEDCLMVFVHIPLDKVLARVAQRNTLLLPANLRGINRVLRFYPLHYIASAIDSSNPDAISYGSIKELVDASNHLLQEEGIPSGDDLIRVMAKIWGIDESTSHVSLTPRWPHHLQVNTGELSPNEAAEMIVAHLCERMAHKTIAPA